MRGDERSRFCQRCSLHVFNVSELSETELRELLVKKGGVVCGRIFKRADGTVMTRDCPTGVRALRLRFFRGLAAAASLLTGLVGVRAATSGSACVPREDGPATLRRVEVALQNRYVDLRETLRETETLGPIIDRFSPQPTYTMGRMYEIRPITRVIPSGPQK
ncbi:MAG: hypothetical protein JNM17_02005 [Archangium sp.]|nr:hypothetical protein [Archangium sp.]